MKSTVLRGIPCFIVLTYHWYCIFNKLKVWDNPMWKKSFAAIFNNNICSLHVSVSQFSNYLNISSFVIIIIFVMVFELWCQRRLLRVPWTARRSNQSILKEISPGCSLEGLMLKLKLQYVGHLMWRADSFEKILMMGKTEGGWRRDDRGWDGWMSSPTQWTWVWVNSGSWWWTGRPGMLWFMGSQRVGHNWADLMVICDQWPLMLLL